MLLAGKMWAGLFPFLQARVGLMRRCVIHVVCLFDNYPPLISMRSTTASQLLQFNYVRLTISSQRSRSKKHWQSARWRGWQFGIAASLPS